MLVTVTILSICEVCNLCPVCLLLHVMFYMMVPPSFTFYVWFTKYYYAPPSSLSDMVDIDTGEVFQGVGLVPLEDKLNSGWVAPVAVRQLSISPESRKEIDEIAIELRCKYKGRHYEEHPTELIKAAVDFGEDYITIFKNKGGEASLETLFCSELVALAYQKFRLLGDDYPANEYTPEDFADSRKLTLTQGVLENEVYLDISP